VRLDDIQTSDDLDPSFAESDIRALLAYVTADDA